MATDPENQTPADAAEKQRLQVLFSSGLLDTAAETAFDELAELAAAICDTPISLVSLVDSDRQWFKSRIGLAAIENPRHHSFCTHAIQQDDLFVIPDTLEDSRFRGNPLVTGDPNIRFYAGYPLRTHTGEKLGTLCVLDCVPRLLSSAQQNSLCVLARQVTAQIELRLQINALLAEIAEKDRLAALLHNSETRLRAFMDNSPAGNFLLDEDGRLVYCNRALLKPFHLEPENCIGQRITDLWPNICNETFRRQNQQVLKENKALRFEYNTAMPGGQVLSWSCYKFPFLDHQGRQLLAGVTLNISRERQAQAELRLSQQKMRELNLKLHKLSMTDGLTHVRNRRGLEECLQREFERARETVTPLSLLMLDVDHFKLFNDSFGHIAGDQVLQRIADLMREYTRKSDIVARYGGEEFIALLPDTEEHEALAIARRLCAAIAADNWKHRAITVSVGVGMLHATVPTPSALVNLIDGALYTAKHNGRNQVRLADCSVTLQNAS